MTLKITFKNNLIVLAADSKDSRDLNMSACDSEILLGEARVTWDFKDNYSLGSRDAHMKDDGIFSSAAFSAKKNSVGDKWDWARVLFQAMSLTSLSRPVQLRSALMSSSPLPIHAMLISTRLLPISSTTRRPKISSRLSRSK